MRHAFIADVHANADALLPVLAEIDSLGIASVFSLGDIVGYGAEPSRCIQIIRQRNIASIVGNHDLAAVGALSIEAFNDNAKLSAQWTGQHLTDTDKEYLTNLPLEFKNEDFQLVHGAPMAPASFAYILSADDVILAFAAMDRRLLFTGHSHVPLGFIAEGDTISGCPMGSVIVPPGARAIVNIGSVGQPRDGNPLAAFAVWDTDTNDAAVIRVKYDTEAAAQKILDAGLPPGNAYRLSLGR